MDYKQQDPAFEDFGNFSYGATGSALGVPGEILLRGAGWAQGEAGTSQNAWGDWYGGAPYGDDPGDQTLIQDGINYYECGCNKTP